MNLIIQQNNLRWGGVFTIEEISGFLREQKLKIAIDSLRDILNEMCCTIDDRKVSIKKLNISQQLDILIVEYMNLEKFTVNLESSNLIQLRFYKTFH